MIHVGDCVEVMAGMPEASVDAIVCDPPYGLEFMGKEWDRLWNDKPHGVDNRRPTDENGVSTGLSRWTIDRPQYVGGNAAQEWHQRWATEALRVAKPGAYLLAFGGTRTVHRLTCALEDAGWVIRDTLVWAYASGFPKSLDVGKAIDKAAGAEREVVGRRQRDAHRQNRYSDPESESTFVGTTGHFTTVTAPATDDAKKWHGWGTALKPAWEPIVLARKPLVGSVAENVLRYGTGALNIDGTRIGDSEITVNGYRSIPGLHDQRASSVYGVKDREPTTHTGRWPANVILTDDLFSGGVEGVVGGGSFTDTLTAWQSSSQGSEPSRIYSPASSATPLWSPTGQGDSSPASATDTAETLTADAATSTAIHKPATGCCAGTTTGGECICGSTARSGKTPTDLSLPATSSTTATTTGSTTDSKTSSASPAPSTPDATRPKTPASSRPDAPRERGTSDDWSDASESSKRNSPPVEANGYSRFFLIPKSARAEREPVFGGLEAAERVGKYGSVQDARPHTREGYEYPRPARRNHHPTVKPLDLMRHLVRLVTPPGGVVLDPFLGSGTTAIAAEMEGFQWIGIEREAEYVEIAEARLQGVQRGLGLDVAAPRPRRIPGESLEQKQARGLGPDEIGPGNFFGGIRPTKDVA